MTAATPRFGRRKAAAAMTGLSGSQRTPSTWAGSSNTHLAKIAGITIPNLTTRGYVHLGGEVSHHAESPSVARWIGLLLPGFAGRGDDGIDPVGPAMI